MKYMQPTYIATSKVASGTVIRDEVGKLHTVDYVAQARVRGYLVAVCTDRHQQALGHRTGTVATYPDQETRTGCRRCMTTDRCHAVPAHHDDERF